MTRRTRPLLLAQLLVSLVFGVTAAASEGDPASAQTRSETAASDPLPDAARRGQWRPYVGTNPLAPFTLVDHHLFRMFYPFATGLEAGAVAVGGVHLSPLHAIEARISAGTAHKAGFSSLVQAEGGWRAFPFATRQRAQGFYAGTHVRWMQLRYRHPGERWHSAMLLPVTGYVFTTGKVFFDLRLSQPLWALGWSSADNTRAATGFVLSPAPGISPILPALGMTVGWRFEPR